jgi:hypothetical protein
MSTKKVKVIDTSNFPSRLPIFQTLTTWLALDRFNAPQWLWGAMGLLFTIIWIVSIIGMVVQEKVDLLGNRKNNP